MIFTQRQINEIVSLLDKYTYTFIAHHIGSQVLTTTQKNTLKAAGVSLSNISQATSNVSQAFKLGLLSNVLGDTNTKNMTYTQLKKYIGSGKMFKLSPLEVAALDNLKYQTAKEVIKFSDKIKSSIGDKLVQVNKKTNTVKHNKLITDAAKQAIINRKGLTSVISDIGHSVENWNRDFGRISDFVMHTALDEGKATGIVNNQGPDALVYKDVYPGACPHCIRLLLEGGVGSAPKLFTIQQLIDNGTNVGRNTKQWLAVIGPIHPWCRCTLMTVPVGFTIKQYQDGLWIWNGKDFIRDLSKVQRKVKRNSKVVVTVNGKKTVI